MASNRPHADLGRSYGSYVAARVTSWNSRRLSGQVGVTPVTYFIWHPNMVALGAISSKLSLTSRDNPVRCVRGDMLSDFDS